MIDYALLPEMFFFKPYSKEELIEKSEFLNDMYMALLEIDNERALDYINEAIARTMRFVISDAPERKFYTYCRLESDKNGGSRLTHEGMLNLLSACLLSQTEEFELKINHCVEIKKLLDKHIDKNYEALADAGYDELLELKDKDYTDGIGVIVEHRPNTEQLMKAVEENKIDWYKFLKDPNEEDFSELLVMTEETECAKKVLASLRKSWCAAIPDGSVKMRKSPDNLDYLVENMPLWNYISKLEEEKRELKEELKEKEETLQERDREVLHLRSLFTKHGLNPDEQQVEIDLSDVAAVIVPDLVLFHFRNDRTLALRYLKGCREHNRPIMAKNDYIALNSLVVQFNDRNYKHGFGKELCDWLNANGCDINYNSFKSNKK